MSRRASRNGGDFLVGRRAGRAKPGAWVKTFSISRDAYRIAAASISWVIADIHELKRSAGTFTDTPTLSWGGFFLTAGGPAPAGKPGKL